MNGFAFLSGPWHNDTLELIDWKLNAPTSTSGSYIYSWLPPDVRFWTRKKAQQKKLKREGWSCRSRAHCLRFPVLIIAGFRRPFIPNNHPNFLDYICRCQSLRQWNGCICHCWGTSAKAEEYHDESRLCDCGCNDGGNCEDNQSTSQIFQISTEWFGAIVGLF